MEKLDVLIENKNTKKKKKADSVQEKVEKIVYPGLENKFLLVRVGDADRPAEAKEILEVQEQLGKIFEDNGVNCLYYVTHHAVSIDIIEKKGV